MEDDAVPYDEIDESIRSLVRALNAFPGVATIGSCGGHDEPSGNQAGPGLWWVLFQIDRTGDGWVSLEFLGWAFHRVLCHDRGVTLEVDAPPPYLNGPGRFMRFVLQRQHTDVATQDSGTVATALDELREEYFLGARAAEEIWGDRDDDGFLSPNRRTASVIGPTAVSDGGCHLTMDVLVGEEIVEVDVELAEVIVEAYRAGIDTDSCCQDSGEASGDLRLSLPHIDLYGVGRAYISFPCRRDLIDFHEAVACGGPRDVFYERMLHWAAPGAWIRTIGVDDLGSVDDDDETPSTAPRMTAGTYQVQFPRTDIPSILERLRRFNAEEHVEHGEVTWESVTVEDD